MGVKKIFLKFILSGAILVAFTSHMAFGDDVNVTYSDLSGEYFGEEDALTRNGRVLLVNDDSAPGVYSVKGQSYWQTDGTKYTTYWEHFGDVYGGVTAYPYLRAYADHVLYTKDTEGNPVQLWILENIYIGNTYANGPSMVANGCYLPNSPTAKPISSESSSAGLAEQGCMVMRNTYGSVVLSPLYTNGVGTIYFDAVNADTQYAGSGVYKIQVRVSVDGGITYTPYPMKPFKRDGTTAFIADQTDTTELKLEIMNGGTADNFYRVVVPVDNSGNVRFMIVRTSLMTTFIEDSSFILLDNILVSYPKSTASLEPYGSYDRSLKGRQVVGWGGAMSVPFPAVGDSVYARARAVVNTNVNAHVAIDVPITRAQMHYRWRYLDQAASDWRTVDLRPDDGFISTQPLDLPSREGDVEFWYEYMTQLPAYRYYDYTGLGLDFKDAEGNALYTEEVTECKNIQTNVSGYESLASGGTDWFFRLRRGRSDYESFVIYVKKTGEDNASAKSYPMWLAGNHMWRGLCPTREEIEGGMLVRIAGRNRQTPGDEDYDLGMVRYSLAKGTSVLPATDMLSERSDDDSWEWFAVSCDAKSGNVLVQLQDDTLAYTIVHADYQDFNGWTDANKQDVANGIFIGTKKDNESTPSAYTTPDSVMYSSSFDSWNETVATNAHWNESFPATKAELDAGTWPLYKPFASTISPNAGFTVGPGRWVNGYYRDNNTGIALQMEGNGNGYIQLDNASALPRGLESVSFKTRVAQTISFSDFAYYEDGVSLTDYTFMTAAAFDINGRKDFAGNASLSLVALYTPGVGCYELRVEQENASITAAGVVSPGTTFRISLYRWAYDEEQEDIVATLLGTTTHGNGNNMFNTTSEGGYYGRLFISVDTSVDGETRIVGGVARTSVARSSFFLFQSYREVAYRDGTDNRLTSGSYGLLAANCPAHFLQPSYGATTVAFGSGWSKPSINKFVSNNYGTYTLTPIATADRVLCQGDIAAGRWAIKKGRMAEVYVDDPGKYGINAVIPETTVKVYAVSHGATDWNLLASVPVVGFGSAGVAGMDTTIPICCLNECSLKIATEIGKDVDVVIDDIGFRQWCGESYDEYGQYGVFDRTLYGSPTNIVFTQGWVSSGVDSAKSCLLSAKRSYSNVATSIRSPRMVDEQTDKGLGLGSVVFDYENAQTNAVLLVQIATNGIALSGFADLTKSTSSVEWTTVTNIDFSAMTAAERKSGSVRVYIGLNGVRGIMRIALDPNVVEAVEKISDPTAFGEVTITGISFRDEPELNKYLWWGWNLRTTDDPAMRNLVDNTAEGKDIGLSLCLNNSVSADIRKDEPAAQFTKKCPFVQTPTFVSRVVDEVCFSARLYDTNDVMARVTLFGAESGDVVDEDNWIKIWAWDITNSEYEVYSKKFDSNNVYRAFRLAVSGVDGVTEPMPDYNPLLPARRVVIDDVLVMEGFGHKVTFDPNGGVCDVVSLNMSNGEYIGSLPTPTRSKALFLGWFTKAEGGDPFDAEGYAVTSDLMLYAHWLTELEKPVIATDGKTSFRANSCEVTITSSIDGAAIYYTDDGTTPKRNDEFLYAGPVTIMDTTTFKAIAVIGDVSSDYATVTIAKHVLTLNEATGVGAGVVLATSGGAPWTPMFDSSAKLGDSTARSGAIGDKGTTWLSVMVEGAGTLSFWCKVSCEHDEDGTFTWDRLMIYTNDVEIVEWRMDGETDWTERTLSFVGGANTVKWVYFKDRTGAAGEDCAWVDGVVWTPSGTAAGVDVGEKGTVEESGGGYVVEAKEGESLTEADFSFGVAKEAYVVNIAAGGKSATVVLKSPEVRRLEDKPPYQGGEIEEGVSEDTEDSAGILASVEDIVAKHGESAIKAKPTPKSGETVGALPVKTYEGLYYQAAWGDDLGAMTQGEKVQATGDTLYLGVIKQKGGKGFYKITVSEQ